MQAELDYSKVCGWIDGQLKPVDKLYAHQKGIRHKAVSVFILNEGAVLLQQRALEKYHSPGLWANTCCTHPLWNEANVICARRRLREELGITNVELEYRHSLEYRADVGGGLVEHENVDVFVGNWTNEASLRLNHAEVTATHWTPIDELAENIIKTPDRYTRWLQIYMREHRDRIFQTA